MKKLTLYLMMMILSLSFFPNQTFASEKNPTTVPVTPTEMPAEIKALFTRLEQIKAMDKSGLKSSEKKELRKEVRAIKAKLRASNRGVYLSVGAIIIIILLLIIII